MADEQPKPVQDTLTPEQKTWYETEVKRVETDTAAKTKTQLEAERLKAVPEKYDVKLTDGSPLDPGDIEKVAAYAKSAGLSNEQAQLLLKHQEETAAGLIARQKTFLKTTIEQWKAETAADKELGGDKTAATQASLKRAMDRFAPEGSAFRKLVDETGYGNHPEFVRFVTAIGNAMAEDKPLGRGTTPGSGERKSDAEVFYGKKTPQ